MVNRSLQLQEIEVFYILPALRKELTMSMKSLGKTQREIAKLLGVTEPAISQYVKSKRASSIEFGSPMKEQIASSAKKIVDHNSLMVQMQRLLKLTRDKRIACKLHESPDLPKNCDACFQNEADIS